MRVPFRLIVENNRIRVSDRRRYLCVFTTQKRRLFIWFEHKPFSRDNYTQKPVTYAPRHFRGDNNNLHPSRYRTPVECTWHPSSDCSPLKSLDYIIITWAASNGMSYDCDIIVVFMTFSLSLRLSTVIRQSSYMANRRPTKGSSVEANNRVTESSIIRFVAFYNDRKASLNWLFRLV